MNFLGHLYLSGTNTELMLGNFSGDFMKGNSYLDYPPGFQKGVLLHRAIDSYTDTHPNVKHCKTFFFDKFHKYSGVVVDIMFDHFLSQAWQLFSNNPIEEFIKFIHESLEENVEMLPPKAQKIVPHFVQKNWLITYSSLSGLELVYSRMAIRTSLPAYSGHAIKVIKENYNLFLNEFINFYYEIIRYVNRKYKLEITPNTPQQAS